MIEFFVEGIPAGEPRPRITTRGRFAHAYTPKTSKLKDGTRKALPIWAWKAAIEKAAKPHLPAKPLEGPIRVDIRFYMPRPKSHYRKSGIKETAPYFHISRPDRDNLDKACLDRLTALGFWLDDAQVCNGSIIKQYTTASHPKTGALFSIRTTQAVNAVDAS